MRKIDLAAEEQRIIKFIRNYLQKSGISRLIIGLSGGLDSAVSATLAAKAVGKKNVSCVILPYRDINPVNLADAKELAEQIDVAYRVIDITPMVDSYFDQYAHDANILRRGNLMARIRMCVLYDLSAANQALVVGTSNRSELLTGYFTQHGDGACAFEPIGHLYKTEVRILAQQLNIPQAIIQKHPSADLWQGQTDEGEMGITYAELDEILWLLTEHTPPLAPVNDNFCLDKIDKVKKMMEQTAYKRRMPALIGDLSC